jgi:hypothetical protein
MSERKIKAVVNNIFCFLSRRKKKAEPIDPAFRGIDGSGH